MSRGHATLALALALAACGRSDPRPAPACPDERFVEALHAAAFHLEHGTPAEGKQQLGQAHALAPPPATMDRATSDMLGRLDEAARLSETDPAQARVETEYVRATLADWPCLPEPLHQQLHTRLPALR